MFIKSARQTKSADIPRYESISYCTRNQQSSWNIRGYKKFYGWSVSFLKYKKFFGRIWFFRVILFCFLGLGLENASVRRFVLEVGDISKIRLLSIL